MMWKYFYSKGTYAWIDVLDELVGNYNTTRHSNTLMKPADVNSSNKNAVWVSLYGSALGELSLPKFRVGDTLRLSRYKSIFGKGYEANFTEEIFKVARVLGGDPNVYELEDHDRRKVLRGGTFRRGEKGRHLQGGENTPKEERHGVGEMVGIRQSVLATVKRH